MYKNIIFIMRYSKNFISGVVLFLVFSIQNVFAQIEEIHLYTFAHSLIDHRPPATPTPSDETTILHWIYDIAQHAGKDFSTTGQFGQLTQHVDGLPPNSNLGYDLVPTSWDEETTSFSDSSINTVLITPANFIQYVSPTEPDPSDPSGRSVINLTQTVFDWVDNEKPDMRYFIYGNWPEMDLDLPYPPNLPSQEEIDFFHNTTIGQTGSFANWWLDYQDGMISARPALNTRLIPVGMIISKILNDVIPNVIPFDELYEDSAPHGRANIYFLAGMITYMAMFEENIPNDYAPYDIISTAIIDNLEVIKNFAWDELLSFDFPNGDSRVFYSTSLSLDESDKASGFVIAPSIVQDFFKIKFNHQGNYNLQLIDSYGRIYKDKLINKSETVLVPDLSAGVYLVRILDKDKRLVYKRKIIKY
jgi:hypothetical protein